MLPTADLVTRIREATGDTQEALARRLGVSFPTVNAWERGRTTPRAKHRRQLEELADSLNVTYGLLVLVIDDDPTTAEIVTAAAAGVDEAITIEVAYDGWEGLVKCGSVRPELVLLDIMMPGIDGLEVARRLPDIDSLGSVKVVFVTSSRDEEVLARARSLGNEVVPKPLDFDDVEAVLKRSMVGSQ